MTTGTRRPGEFCWINMLTPDPTAARDFFGRLLGWTYVEMPGMGHRAQAGGRDIGAIYDLFGPNVPPGNTAHIGVMVKVSDVDATCARVKALGGRVKAAFDVADTGRMAVVLDPDGAEFDVWQPAKMQGTDADSDRHGVPSWFEVRANDVARVTAFYAALFGWTPNVMAMPAHPYTTFQLGDAWVAGLMGITPDMGGMKPHWATFITVDDVNATARDAARAGATVVVPPTDVPGVGRFTVLKSPQGVAFYPITYAG